jgi:hypothetical protein
MTLRRLMIVVVAIFIYSYFFPWAQGSRYLGAQAAMFDYFTKEWLIYF